MTPTNEQAEELKSCPWCAKQPRYKKLNGGLYGCCSTLWLTKEEWNTRTPSKTYVLHEKLNELREFKTENPDVFDYLMKELGYRRPQPPEGRLALDEVNVRKFLYEERPKLQDTAESIPYLAKAICAKFSQPQPGKHLCYCTFSEHNPAHCHKCSGILGYKQPQSGTHEIVGIKTLGILNAIETSGFLIEKKELEFDEQIDRSVQGNTEGQ